MVLYRSFLDAMKELPPEQFKDAMLAVTEYAMDDVMPECTGIAKAIFIMAKPQIDANMKRYLMVNEAAETTTKHKPKRNQVITKVEPKRNLM